MFSNASNFVHDVDNAFLIILGISFFLLISLTIIMVVFVVKYNKKKHSKAVQIKDNSLLEITWTVIPMILVIYMFYIGWEGFLPMRKAPKDAMVINVVGKMWKWTFEYPGNKQSDTLVLPINKPVKVNLISKDVIHGFFIPAFRIKEDVVPGYKNYTWFIPGELGDFDLVCSSYCGVNHSYMSAIVRVVPNEKYTKWVTSLIEKESGNTKEGYTLLDTKGCLACHSVDGSKIIGPTFKGLFGSTIEVVSNGVKRKILADDEYIKTSIYEPNKDVVVGYDEGLMQSYTGTVNNKELSKINEYLKSLKK